MFREKLHKDLDGISPDEELLLKITKSMQEEAQKPRPKMYSTAIRFGGMAAAVCMIAVGAAALTSNGGVRTAENAASESITDSKKSDENLAAAETTAAMQAELYIADEFVAEEGGNAFSEEECAAEAEDSDSKDSVCEVSVSDDTEEDIKKDAALCGNSDNTACSAEEAVDEGLTEHVQNQENAEMTRHSLTSEVMHCFDRGLTFDPDNTQKVKIELSLPSEWELSATVASLNGVKIFEICPPYPSDEVYNYESFKFDDVNGNEILVHEEKHGSENDPYLYYIYETVGDYSVKFYVINCGEYNLYLHFNAEQNVSEEVVFEIIESVTVT